MKKRKILSFMLTLCLLFQTILSDAVPVLAAPEDEAGFSLEETDAGEDPFPEEEEIGENEADGLEYGDFVYTSNSSGVTITGYKGTDTAVVIPSVIDEKDVIAIKEAFKDNTVIESVTVPGSVLTIGQNSFYGCTALSEVHLPDTLTEIARNAFYNAHSLASVDLPDGLKTIGNYAFQNCSALTAVTLPAALESVGEGAFKGSALASILIPAGLTSIGSNAFMTVTEMSFEAGTVKIPAKAASGADQLSSLSIPSSVTEIGESAFLNCSSLTAVTLPDGLVKIGASAFKGSGISEFTLPATLTSIDSGALQPAKRLIFAPGTTTVAFSCFKSDTYLESVSFPDTLESIGKEEFKGCKGLTELVIPAGVHVNVSAFENCTGLKKVELGDNVIVDTAAFKGCSSIESIRRGNNVTIAAGAFEGGQGAVPGSNVWYSHSAASGILVLSGIGSMPDFDDPSEAPWAGLRDQITTVRIEEGVTTVGAKAFYGCSNLQYVSFPKGLESIGREAFAACPELCEIIFAGDAPRFGSNVFKDSGTASGCIKAYYPKTATGWGNGYQKLSDLIRWEAWDDTLSSSDIILVLDRSDSMSGKKIAKLREAACKFIDVVGGKKMNTRIAVVMYNGGASVLSEFTDENGPLMDLVDGLDATGGTNYLKALTVAEDLMKSSDADHKFIIMFSDGQPNDSEDAIYEKADALREQYTIFTVGLMSGGSSDDRYRQILINVAGDENHYFEVDDLELLVSTFQNLSNDVKRQDETTAEIIRHNLRKDLLNDHVEFTEGSQEVASISVIPGLKLGSYDHVDLLSNNKVVLSSVNGYFNGIKPGCIFAPGASVYGVIYDSKGKELQRVRLGLEITGKYTITYQMNDGTGDVYLTQEVTGGELIPEPDAPEWDGHRFMGWYTSVSGSGLDFFSMYNSFNRMKLEEDLVLYAHWTAADGSLDIKKDVWGFSDSSASFASDDYEISYGEYAELLASVKDPVTKQLIKEIKTHKWSGSSFGMSSAVVLNKEGFINITEYDATCLYLRQAELLLNTKGDQDAGDIESMITYFQLRKALEYVNSASLEFLPDKESNNIAHIVEKLRETAGPCVLIVGMSSGNTPVGTHAVVAYDYSEGIGSESSFKVYDCTKGADKVYTVRVSRSGSDYSADTTAWASDWGYKIFLQCVLDGDELTRGEDPAGRSFQADAAVLPGYYLETSYGSFTVSNGSESAVFVNGLKTSGDLEAEGFGICSEPGAAKQYKVKLPLLAEGKSYTISDASGATVYETLAYDYEGFLVKVSAASAGTVKFDASGRVETVFTTAVSQKVGTGISGMNTSWYHAEVECVSKGLTLVPEKTGVSFSSAAAATAQVTASGDIRDHVFTDVALGTDALTLTEKDGKTVILDKNGNRVASDDSGFTVVFDSRHGSYVDRIEGVMSGEKIAEPMDPRRDGFLFTGWYRDPYCSSSQLWDFERDTVTEDMILYAGWTLDENYYLIVTFRMKGEDAHLLYLLKGTKLTQESCPKAADGTVLKWYSDPGCTSEWDFDQTLDRNTELYSVDWNSGSRTEGDVPESEIPEGGIPNGVWVASIPAQEYTGKALKPSVHVYYYKKALIEGRDYTLSYKNNKKVFDVSANAADSAKAPKVIVKMRKNYSGTISASFSILPADIAGATFSAEDLSAIYNGSAQKPKDSAVKLCRNGKALKQNKDYKLSWEDRDYVGVPDDNTRFTVLLSGQGNYTGEKKLTYTIYGTSVGGKEQILLDSKDVKVAAIPDQEYLGKIYEVSDLKDKKGEAITLLTYKGEALENGVDYRVKFSNARKPGTATITIKGMGGRSDDSSVAFVGSIKVNFKIVGKNISKATVKGINRKGYTYTGSEIRPEGVTLQGIDSRDYSVSYENNVKAGTAKIIFTGKNGYSGQKIVKFRINKVKFDKNSVKINGDSAITAPYAKDGARPSIRVTCEGRLLVKGRDYTLSYKNNRKVSSYRSKPLIIIVGKGNYKGKYLKSFTIRKASLSTDVKMTVSDVAYSSKAGQYTPKIRLVDMNGNALKAGRDYDKKRTTYVIEETREKLTKKSVPAVGTVIRVTVYAKSRSKCFTGSVSATYRVVESSYDLSKAKIKIKDQVYTGGDVLIEAEEQFSELEGKDGTALHFGTDFEVVSYTKNDRVGTAQVVFRGLGDGIEGYSGTKTVKFRIKACPAN